jgi:hypothetical protein
VFDRKFIRDRHVVRGADGRYDGETLFGWDDREKQLAFWYWTVDFKRRPRLGAPPSAPARP